ncbi:MAG: phosphatase PAP2 family protein [Paludibacter sp.]|nr:phosphatase PAP2 family protein [Paludibacter sp.]
MKIKYKQILTPTEIIIVCYILLTAIYVLVFFRHIESAPQRLAYRGIFLLITALLAWLTIKSNNKVVKYIRYIFPVLLIVFWYPETSYLNDCIFNNLDRYFADADQFLFGCQPSLLFSKVFDQRFFSELMAFGYFSFYLTIAFTVIYFYVKFDRRIYEKISFIVLFSFFAYYLIFILLPVEGPQFYFPCNKIPEGFLFYKMLAIVQFYGEKRTGAFPSSHIGISLIFLFIFFKYNRRIFLILLPIFVILALSTVYIKAHYIIDVIAGFVTAPLFYYLAYKVFDKMWPISYSLLDVNFSNKK